MGVLADVSPLRHREYRLLFVGTMISFVGAMVAYVAVPFEVFRLTHSSLAVGLLGLAEAVPMLATALIGGALADAHERRRLVALTQLALVVTALALVGNASLRHPQLWVLYVAVGVFAGLDGLQRPSLDAIVPRVVPGEDIPAAAALAGLRGNAGMIAGPALAGLLIASLGVRGTFAVAAAGFGVALVVLLLMRTVPPAPDADRPSLRSVADGLRHTRERPELLGSLLVDLTAMVFGMPTALFPALAVRLHGGPSTLGLLYAAPAVGALSVSLVSGWTGRIARHGLAIVISASAWGLAIVAFGLVRALAPALALIAVAGGADMVSGLFRMTLWNQSVPDHLRGRLAGIEILVYAGGPSLGNLEAGGVAAVAGVPASIISGGILCVAGTLCVAWRLPGLIRYRAPLTRPTPAVEG